MNEENPRDKVIKLLKSSSAAFIDSFLSNQNDTEAAVLSSVYLNEMQKVIAKVDKVRSELKNNNPDLDVEDFIKDMPEINRGPSKEDIQRLMSQEPSEVDEIDLTREFEEIFEARRKTPKSSQEDIVPNKKSKVVNEMDSFMEVQPVTTSTQVALSGLNNLFNKKQNPIKKPDENSSKEKLLNNFANAWMSKAPQVNDKPKPNIDKLKTSLDVKLPNPWAKSANSVKPKEIPKPASVPWVKPTSSINKASKVIPPQNANPWAKSTNLVKKTSKEEITKPNLNPLSKKLAENKNPAIENEYSLKNLFHVNIPSKNLNPNIPNRKPQSPPKSPPKKEEKTGFISAHQFLWQDKNRKIKPMGLSTQSKSSRKMFVSPLITEDKPETNPQESELNFDHPLLVGFNKELLEKIHRDIVVQSSSQAVSWDDIAGLSNAKAIIHESIILPAINPEIYSGLRQPSRAFLLFGPPGTGKTLIGKCIANEVDATFMSISASTLTSKWIGESETLVRAMFAYAKVLQPCVIFFDEVDSLLGKRDGEGSAGESMTRLKTEFLIQLDGANALKESDKVILIGATNRPHAIDEAMIRRFTRRIMIPLPNSNARMQLIANLFSNEIHSMTGEDLEVLAKKTQGYSGADLKNLAIEACHIPCRKAYKIHGHSMLKKDIAPTSLTDFLIALKTIRPTVSQETVDMLVQWNKELGSGAAELSDDED